jgi:hypothetical protein
VLINACNTAHVDDNYQGPVGGTGRLQGMPYAWTHREVRAKNDLRGFNVASHMSYDGYNDADTGKFVYLGFWYGSASLSQKIDSGPPFGIGPYYHSWLEKFFEYALMCSVTVNNALDEASQIYFNCDFDQTPLYDTTPTHGEAQDGDGFIACWPMYGDNGWDEAYPWPDRRGWLEVYGNGHLKLYQPSLTLSANNGLSPSFTLSSSRCGSTHYGTGNYKVIGDWYTVSVNTPPGYDFSRFTYRGCNYNNNPSEIQVGFDGELKAYYTSVSYDLEISVNCPLMGSTDPSGTQPYPKNTWSDPIQSNPNSGYVLDYWKKDNNDVGNTPKISVYMDQDHTLQAVFGTAPSYKYGYDIDDNSQDFVSAPELLTGWEPDGQYATIENYNGLYPGYCGWIIGTTNSLATGHVYMHGYCSDAMFADGSHIEVYVSYDGSSWSLIGTPYVYEGDAYWIDCGTYPCVFNYIKFTTENVGEVAYIHIDSVKAVP